MRYKPNKNAVSITANFYNIFLNPKSKLRLYLLKEETATTDIGLYQYFYYENYLICIQPLYVKPHPKDNKPFLIGNFFRYIVAEKITDDWTGGHYPESVKYVTTHRGIHVHNSQLYDCKNANKPFDWAYSYRTHNVLKLE